MSQRTFVYADLNILAGWDRPLQRFFLVIEDQKDIEAENDNYVFSNLKLPNPDMSLEQVKQVLTDNGIEWPETLFTDLALDQKNNVGNLRHCYNIRS